MKKGIIFDLDDTLISEKAYIKSGFKEVSKEISLNHNLDFNYVLKTMMDLFEENTGLVFNRTLEKLNVDYLNEDIGKLIEVYRNHKPDIMFFDDVNLVLKELKRRGYKLGIITDGYKETQRNKLDVLKAEELFHKVIVTDELGREYWKPNIYSYNLMSEGLGLSNEECVYVGDNLKKDFEAGDKLGWLNILIKRKDGVYKGIKENKELVDIEIKDLNELLDIFMGGEYEEDIICNHH